MRLFDAFFTTLSQGTRRRARGVKRIADEHGFATRSRRGGSGATFRVTWVGRHMAAAEPDASADPREQAVNGRAWYPVPHRGCRPAFSLRADRWIPFISRKFVTVEQPSEVLALACVKRSVAPLFCDQRAAEKP